MIKTLIFDADGVLISPWRFSRYLAEAHGITPEMTGAFFGGVFNDCLDGKAELSAVLPPFLAQWGWSASTETFIATWLDVEDAVDQRLAAAIGELRRAGLKVYLASNQERQRAAYMRARMGLDELFDALFFSCELGCQKPAPAFYTAISEALNQPGAEILFWDDSRKNVDAARQSGWQAAHYTGFAEFRASLAADYPALAGHLEV